MSEKAEIAIESTTFRFALPQQLLSTPDNVVWHMILDYELTQLSRPETGVIGSVGFAALGGAIGLAPSFFGLIGKLTSSAPPAIGIDGLWTLILFPVCVAGALICLTIFGLWWKRNRGLATQIRSRKKSDFLAEAASALRSDAESMGFRSSPFMDLPRRR